MAALVLGLAGAAIGGSQAVTGVLGISATMGASIGWSIGSMLGGMIGPKTRIEGPRLQDGKVQAATHGQVIPIIYGSFRTAGNILDFSGMREHAKTETSKKAKSSVTTYSYECDVAVGICAGEIVGVRRIWANNELIYSVAGDADLATIQASNKAAGNIRIYTGSEDQLPDPTLEALHGAGNVPAYRGLAYIVISRIWVEKYGNRLPNFEFEVVGRGVGKYSFREIPATAHEMSAMADSFRAYNRYFGTNGWRYENEVEFDNNIINWVTELQQPYRHIFGSSSSSYDDSDPSGGFDKVVYQEFPPERHDDYYYLLDFRRFQHARYFARTGDDGFSLVISSYDGLSGTRVRDQSSGYVGYVPNRKLDIYRSSILIIGNRIGNDYVRIPFSLAWRDYNEQWDRNPIDQNDCYDALHAVIFHIDSQSFVIGYGYRKDADNNQRLHLVKGTIKRSPYGDLYVDSIKAAATVDDYYSYASAPGVVGTIASSSTGVVGDYLFVGNSLDSSIVRVDLLTGEIKYIRFPDIISESLAFSVDGEFLVVFLGRTNWIPPTNTYSFKRLTLDKDGSIVTESGWSEYFRFSTDSGQSLAYKISGGELFVSVLSGTPGVSLPWDGSQAVKSFVLSDSILRDGIGLRDVVSDVCARVGVQPDLVDIPPDTRVGGYCISRQMSARGAIEPLQNAYFFDAVESDNGLKFVMRGAEPVATIVDDDMMAGIDQAASGDPCTIVRGQEVELPQQVSVSYADWDSDYQTSAELVQRQATPSVNRVATELPIAMSATQAARIADVWMYQAWSERTQLAFKVGPEHMLLEPTDVVTVQTAGRSYKARITSKTDDRGVIDIAAVVDGGRYTSSATGSSNFGSQTSVATLANTLAFFINAPIVSDADNDGGFYAALLPEAVLANNIRWGGATLLAGETTGAAPTRTVASVAAPPATVAVVKRAGPLARAIGRIDQSGSILVRTNQTLLSSISRDELFNHSNLFAVVYGQNAVAVELLQFQYAEEVGEFTYELTGLLRGRFGTESGALVQIPEGAFLVQIDPRVGVLRVPGVPQTIGRALTYKAVTTGQSIEDAEPLAFASTGHGLRPYAPVRVHAWRVGYDWHIRWVRRSRIDGGWREGVDAPLGEAQELYSVRIEPHGQEFTTTTPSFIYTEAMQLANGGRVADFWFSVAQVSAAVGRGDAAFWKNY